MQFLYYSLIHKKILKNLIYTRISFNTLNKNKYTLKYNKPYLIIIFFKGYINICWKCIVDWSKYKKLILIIGVRKLVKVNAE